MIYKFYQQHIFPHLLNQVMQTPSLMDQRRQLLLPIAGDVLEIGFGTGVNLPFYQNVETLYALEPNADLYQLAAKRIHESAIHVQHIQAYAEKLPFADASLDHIVSTWTLCSIENLAQALTEMYRVLKPNGTLHLVEHVQYQDNAKLQHLQNLLTPIQKRLADGCHLNRNIEQALHDAHFDFTEQHYFAAQGIPKLAQHMFFARAQK
ncbi:class I SAM-dependent methyltransferase [Acinetobacter bohemicus]|uniref:Methyltransferase domain-containing protein n=1 Tax=Acinetobacter bohemicus TaxID=1435036 RepID=A0A1I6S564_9GAMM|nr:class I SAM-dependent methyltransferase [Acinetobacter bohemicus]KAB0654453.1 class I SAM-dependent methyltransferase [Acinetobacter bohemicus]SFS72072.1 Methyltransferase domain-containing protein [Acinetobacter bohemicus]